MYLVDICRKYIKQILYSKYSLLGNNEKPSAWNTWTWQQQQQWNWNWASTSTPPPTKTPIMEPVNTIRPPYVAPPVLTEPPPSFPMIPPNKPFTTNVSFYYFKIKKFNYLFFILFQNYWAGPNTRVPPPIEANQWNKPNMISNVDDRSQDLSYIGLCVFIFDINKLFKIKYIFLLNQKNC